MSVIGVYIVCLLLFPLCALVPTKRSSQNTQELLEKNDSAVTKGISICFVMLAHLISMLENEYSMPALKLFTVLGGMGVLLFFFLSGYGLYKGYAARYS